MFFSCANLRAKGEATTLSFNTDGAADGAVGAETAAGAGADFATGAGAAFGAGVDSAGVSGAASSFTSAILFSAFFLASSLAALSAAFLSLAAYFAASF